MRRWSEQIFLSEDPIGVAGGINIYSFASSNPITRRDPLGLQDEECPEGTTPLTIGERTVCVTPLPLDPIVVVGTPWWAQRDGGWPWSGGGYESPPGSQSAWGAARSAWSGPRLRRTGFDELKDRPPTCEDLFVTAVASTILDGSTIFGIAAGARIAALGVVQLAQGWRLSGQAWRIVGSDATAAARGNLGAMSHNAGVAGLFEIGRGSAVAGGAIRLANHIAPASFISDIGALGQCF